MAKVSKAEREETPLCPTCKRPMITGWDRPMCSMGCNTTLSGTHAGVHDLRPFSARIWTGEQVYGKKKLLSDELRSDTEAALMGGTGAGLKG